MKLNGKNISEVFNQNFKWVKIFIMVAAYGYLIYTFATFKYYNEFSQYFATSGAEGIKYLFFCLLLIPLNWLLESAKWKEVLSKIQVLSIWQAVKSVLIGLTSGFFTPNRVGEPVGRTFVLNDGNKTKGVICSLICTLSQSFATLLFACIACVSMGLFACELQLSVHNFMQVDEISVLRNFGVVAMIAVCLLYFTLPFWVGILKLKSEKLQAIARDISQISYVSLLKVSLYSIARFAVYSFQYYLMLRFFAVQITLQEALVFIPINYLLVSIIPSVAFAEMGIRGTSAVLVLSAVTQNTLGVALAAVALWFLNYVIPMLTGSLLLIQQERQ